MSVRDRFHEAFVRALEKDGWTITDDPLTITFEGTALYIDIGAERVIAAERAGRRIAVEIKSFLSPSPVHDLEEALGQFVLYEETLKRSVVESDRTLYLAVRRPIYASLFEEGIGKILIASSRVRIIVFDATTKEIDQWIE